jgi:hypothetical protein
VPETRTLVVGACGVSAGLHGALCAVHARELPLHAAAFLTAAFALTLTALVLAFRPELGEGPVAAAALFAALLVAYPLARHEGFGAAAGISKVVEAAGLGLSVRLWRLRSPVTEPGVAVVFLLCAAGGIMLGGGHAH